MPLINYDATPFLHGSVGTARDRLNARADILLYRNRDKLANARVLDLAANNGRFSWAALQAGAAHVTAVEGRQNLVDEADQNMADMNVEPNRFTAHCADIFTYLRQVEPGSFDVILNFGVLYHTLYAPELLRLTSAALPKWVVLDTAVYKPHWLEMRWLFNTARALPKAQPRHIFDWSGFKRSIPRDELLVLSRERWVRDQNSIERPVGELHEAGERPHEFTYKFSPTAAAVEKLMQFYGLQWEKLDWSTAHLNETDNISDYLSGRRVSYLAACNKTT